MTDSTTATLGMTLPETFPGDVWGDKLNANFTAIDNFANSLAASVKNFGAVGNGTSDDTEAIQAAVTQCVTSGNALYWPVGTYLTTGSIANFHDVRHIGPGAIRRGSDTFRFQSDFTATNKIYVSTTGSDSNDGLSASQPLLTIQRAFDVWQSRYSALATYQFVIDVAAGTYTEGATLDGVKSPVELVLEGKVSGSTPTVIIDGTAATSASGLNFNNCSNIRVRRVEASNFRLNSGSSGIAFQNGTRGVIDNCIARNNTFADFNCSDGGEMVVIGTCTVGSGSIYGLRYYRLAGGSVGDGTNPIVADGCLEAGILVRDGSKVVCDNNITLNNCVSGARIIKHGYLELRNATVSNNTEDGIYADTLSIFDNATGTVTFTGNARDKRFTYSSIDRSGIISGTLVPNILRGQNGLTGQLASSGYDVVIDNNGNTGLQFLTSGTAFINLDFNKTQRLSVDLANNRMTMVLNSANVYRWNTTSYIPITDNAVSNGASGFRWSNTFSTNFRPGAGTAIWTSGAGTPEGVVTAPVGSLYTRTDGGAGTTLYVKESGAGNTGWVAK